MTQQYYPQYLVSQFHDKFAPNQKNETTGMKIERRSQLIAEEYREVQQALTYWDNTDRGMTSGTEEECREELAKELADLLYVIYGTADELGIPLYEIFMAVHESNMRKVWPDGEVKYNEYGKVIKPPTYTPPNLKVWFTGKAYGTD